MLLLLSLPLFAVAQDSPRNESWQVDNARSIWISQIMPQALSTFYPWSSRNEECTFQGMLYKQHLSNLTLWAVQMLDSSVLSESGIVSGSDYNFGNFDQCKSIHVPQYNFNGKHCFANLRFAPRYFNETKSETLFYTTPGPFSSVWNKVKRVNEPRIKYRDNFYWSICIPSGCDHSDLEESLKRTLTPLFDKTNITVNVTVNDLDCDEDNKPPKLTLGTLAYLFVMAGFLLTAIIATFLHSFLYRKNEKGDEENKILMFSLHKNISGLFKPEKQPELQFLCGVKVLSMFCIIYGHRMLITYAFPLLNVEDHEEGTTKLMESINLSGNIIVNTFLQVSGFLMLTKMFNDMEKKRVNVPLYLIYKWARMTPVYAAIICTFIFLEPLGKNEPLWGAQGLERHETCKRNFWSHILYINNYYDPHSECLLPAWYLAVDMQLFVICVFNGYIISKCKRVGYFLLGCLLIVSLITPSIVIYYKGYEPILMLYINFIRNYRNEDDYVNSYIPTHMRAAPYFYGMVTAVIAFKLRKREYVFNKVQSAAGMIITPILMIGTLLSSWAFYIPDRIPSTAEKISYPFIQRTTWCLGISWIMLSSLFNDCGYIVKKILCSSIFIPLNKLMLCVMLVHPLLQSYSLLVQRRPTYVNTIVLIWMAAGDIFVSYLISLVFHLVIEAPLTQILQYSLKKLSLKEK